MKTFPILYAVLSLVLLFGCAKREELAARLAEERRVAEAKSPPSPSEFRDAAMRGDTPGVLAAIERGVDVNATDEEGRTALQLAAFDGHHEVVKLLLDRGANADHADVKGRTALMFASTGPHLDAVNLLIAAGADVNAVDSDEQFTALMFAAAEGQMEVVEALLRAGADPNRQDIDNDTATDFAAQNGHAEIVSLLQSEAVPASQSP